MQAVGKTKKARMKEIFGKLLKINSPIDVFSDLYSLLACKTHLIIHISDIHCRNSNHWCKKREITTRSQVRITVREVSEVRKWRHNLVGYSLFNVHWTKLLKLKVNNKDTRIMLTLNAIPVFLKLNLKMYLPLKRLVMLIRSSSAP